MSTIINGSSPSITFSDSTTQTTAFTGSASQITSGTLPSAQLPTGSVLQVVNATNSTYITTSSGTFASTGVTATVTPKFTTSKVLVSINLNGLQSQTANQQIRLYLYKNGSFLAYLDDFIGYGLAAATGLSSSYTYFDSPASTSSTTYAVYWANNGSGNALTLNNYVAGANRTMSSITLMEIAG